jgi:hypothetical protein
VIKRRRGHGGCGQAQCLSLLEVGEECKKGLAKGQGRGWRLPVETGWN